LNLKRRPKERRTRGKKSCSIAVKKKMGWLFGGRSEHWGKGRRGGGGFSSMLVGGK